MKADLATGDQRSASQPNEAYQRRAYLVSHVSPPAVREWSCGFASVSPGQIPSKGYRLEERCETYERCCAFIDSHGTQAFEMGWDTVSLFGVSPDLGIIRGDWTGVLMPFWGDLVEVTPESIAFGKVRAWRHQPVRYRGIPVWQFGK